MVVVKCSIAQYSSNQLSNSVCCIKMAGLFFVLFFNVLEEKLKIQKDVKKYIYSWKRIIFSEFIYFWFNENIRILIDANDYP